MPSKAFKSKKYGGLKLESTELALARFTENVQKTRTELGAVRLTKLGERQHECARSLAHNLAHAFSLSPSLAPSRFWFEAASCPRLGYTALLSGIAFIWTNQNLASSRQPSDSTAVRCTVLPLHILSPTRSG